MEMSDNGSGPGFTDDTGNADGTSEDALRARSGGFNQHR